MASKELIALLKSLQGSGAGSVLNPGLLAQLPSLIAAAAEPSPAGAVPDGGAGASAASLLSLISGTPKPSPAGAGSRGGSITSAASLLSLISGAPKPSPAGVGSPGGALASAASLPSLISGAPKPSPAGHGSRGGVIASAASTVASSALRGVSGGLTLLPVVSSLLKLFGVGRKKEELPALERFDLPAPIRAEAGLSQSGETFLIDRGVGDRIRQLPAPAGSTSFAGSHAASAPPNTGASITVNVQAMDSQSFMDRREDIARAVREAMLQSHSLNDVVSEL